MGYFRIFQIEGDPKGAKRKRAFAFKGKDGNTGVRMYSDTKGPEYTWREQIVLAIKDDLPIRPLTGPVRVDWIARFRRPKSHFRTGRNAHKLKAQSPKHWHVQKPDRDNLDKVILDVLKEYKLFDKDDCQACTGLQAKVWCKPDERPGMILTIAQLEDRE